MPPKAESDEEEEEYSARPALASSKGGVFSPAQGHSALNDLDLTKPLKRKEALPEVKAYPRHQQEQPPSYDSQPQPEENAEERRERRRRHKACFDVFERKPAAEIALRDSVSNAGVDEERGGRGRRAGFPPEPAAPR